ncbi:MAG TPA: TRAP transporter substrate-binding protein, partial [Candidatus Atribacteria bacterium]|nr:TRAP transporter substrate-binding protein [Candidatus Atribacteria bacterium]
WTKLLKAEEIEVTAESTAASVENCRLTGSGEIQIGMAMASVSFKAYKGIVQFEGKPQSILGLFSMYPAPQHILTLDPDIKSIRDLKGKKVSVGAPGSGNETISRLIIETAGLTYDDMTVSYYSQPEAAQALKDRNVDVVFWNFAYPGSAVQEVTAVRDVYFISVDDDILKELVAKYPYYQAGKIPANTYKGQDYDVATVQDGNDVVVNKDLDENTAYLLVKTLFENAKEIHDVHPVAKLLIPEIGVKTVTPLHPGAEKYFKEKGLL